MKQILTLLTFALIATVATQAQPQATAPVVYNTNYPSLPAPNGAGYTREHPAPTPGVETGCAFFPRGSQNELDCEVENYQHSGILKWIGQWMETVPQMKCLNFTASRQITNGIMEVNLNDGRTSYTLAYKQGKLLVPDSVPAYILWFNRDAGLRFLYSCKEIGYQVGELPPMTVRARTVGEY